MRVKKVPLISGILPTRNRAEYLKKALEGLTSQTLEPDEFEVIIIDDGSSDETQRVVDFFRESLQMIYIHQEHAGISAAKNRGFGQARAPILLFLDDDDVARLTLLEEHLWTHERYPDPAVAVLGYTGLSRRVAAAAVMHFVTEVGFYLFCYPRIPTDEWLDYTYFWGGRSSCKTAFLRKYGFFNPIFRFGCEDIELGYRLSKFGLRVIYNPRAVSTMVRCLTFDDFCRRIERQGASNWVFGKLHPTNEVLAWGRIQGAEERWAALEPNFETVLANARHLDDLVNHRIEEGLELDPALVAELHNAYWQSFDGCRLRGIVKAAAECAMPVKPIKSSSKPFTEQITVWKKYSRSQYLIEIDITYNCNLRCYNCNRSCTQAPSNDSMTIEQVAKFIDESITKNIQWKRIRILGGEPTLHQKLVIILEMLNKYRIDMLPNSNIELVTNGFGRHVNERLSKIPDNVAIENSQKTSRVSTTLYPFNIAPIDLDQFKDMDFSGGCWIASECGIGLTPYGYYPCAIAGGIDRIFGFDQGRKAVPDPDDKMLSLLSMFCRYCGHFVENERPSNHEQPIYPAQYSHKETGRQLGASNEIMSSTWIEAYDCYRQNAPKLTRY